MMVLRLVDIVLDIIVDIFVVDVVDGFDTVVDIVLGIVNIFVVDGVDVDNAVVDIVTQYHNCGIFDSGKILLRKSFEQLKVRY